MSERYIGKVIDNNDPDKEGKCQIYIEHLMSGFQPSQYQWFRQDKEFTSFIPEINDLVWCYFEDELAFRQGYYQEKVTLKSYHTHNQNIGSMTGTYPNVKYIKLANGVSIAMNSSETEVSIVAGTSEIFIDPNGYITITSGTNKIEMNASGVKITTGDATLWKPNTIPNCLFTGSPHCSITKLTGA